MPHSKDFFLPAVTFWPNFLPDWEKGWAPLVYPMFLPYPMPTWHSKHYRPRVLSVTEYSRLTFYQFWWFSKVWKYIFQSLAHLTIIFLSLRNIIHSSELLLISKLSQNPSIYWSEEVFYLPPEWWRSRATPGKGSWWCELPNDRWRHWRELSANQTDRESLESKHQHSKSESQSTKW